MPILLSFVITHSNCFISNPSSQIVQHATVSRNDFYQAIKEHTQIVAVCKEIESSLADITTESKKYVRNEFMTIYKRHSEQAVSIGYDERLKLT
jgi:hypothetical protein